MVREVTAVRTTPAVVDLVHVVHVLTQDRLPRQLGIEQLVQEDLDRAWNGPWLIPLHTRLHCSTNQDVFNLVLKVCCSCSFLGITLRRATTSFLVVTCASTPSFNDVHVTVFGLGVFFDENVVHLVGAHLIEALIVKTTFRHLEAALNKHGVDDVITGVVPDSRISGTAASHVTENHMPDFMKQ